MPNDDTEACQLKHRTMPAEAYSLEPSPAQMGDTTTLAPGEWTPIDEIGTQIYVYGDQPVDVAVQYAEVESELRQLRREVDVARELIGTVRTIAETWSTDPGAFPDGAADPMEQIATVLLGPRDQRRPVTRPHFLEVPRG
ncbi:hypothetical protein [Mangrovihabitans endophyticus]|uniref:Uncharacterized protein n=1 Tax=Mangrovihabitans endophyticus TaxID=1751298 RepID=A0A8J3BZW5_9ACTN|nr:hypothetical protein [Mangrovihabitans endophyticus]GGK89373.1 hypothetical protein GCM10012284_24180 [Mangrovihabitans endophyticus]